MVVFHKTKEIVHVCGERGKRNCQEKYAIKQPKKGENGIYFPWKMW